MMKNVLRGVTAGLAGLVLLFVCGLPAVTAAAPVVGTTTGAAENLSLKLEIEHAISKGLDWLKTSQNPDGSWSQADYPALAAMVLTAYMGEPTGKYVAPKPEFIQQGYSFLLQNRQPDGGIYAKGLGNYNTSVSLIALLVANDPAYTVDIKKARNYISSLQGDDGQPGVTDSPYDGGIGYGDRYQHSDMSNTVFALEALYYSKHLSDSVESQQSKETEVDWNAVVTFIQRCQNLPGFNDQPWASDDAANKGGFVYFPGDSKAGEMELPSGKKALRSYGSISYAGMLSYIYADMQRDDPRVTAVYDWLVKHYTLDENPGMGAEGLFYYYQMMAKALDLYGQDQLTLDSGQQINWKKDLALRLLNLQKPEGLWINENGRWWERDPVLVTAYAVLTLERIYRGL